MSPEEIIDERLQSIFWVVVFRHLTPETQSFIRSELITTYKIGRESNL